MCGQMIVSEMLIFLQILLFHLYGTALGLLIQILGKRPGGIRINLLEIFPIIGVISRDKYLDEKEISAKEIDTHDPKNQ